MAERWTNWTGDQRCAPSAIVRPRGEGELAAAIRAAAARGETVRAAGSGHSFSDCACTDGVMVDLRAMRRVLDADAASGLVAVEGGITLAALGPELARRGLSLANQGDVDTQTIAGALATATHGTGARLRNLSAPIAAMRLVTSSGDVLEVSEESDPEALLAARVSLGTLGIVSAVTLRCVPLYTLHRRDEPRPLDESLERLDELAGGSDHFEMFVFPYSDVALTRSSRRSHEEPSPPSRVKRWFDEELVQNGLFGALCRTGRSFPRLVPRLNRMIAGAMSPSEIEGRAHGVYATRRRVRFTEMEYAVPRERAREAVAGVLELVERRRLPILFPLEVRFAAADDAFLSTAHGRDTCYVAVHQYRGMEYETYFRAVEELMDGFGGRPHWGKRHYQRAATLRGRYPDWDRFQAVRARLDPDGVFANDYTRRVLGDPAAVGATAGP